MRELPPASAHPTSPPKVPSPRSLRLPCSPTSSTQSSDRRTARRSPRFSQWRTLWRCAGTDDVKHVVRRALRYGASGLRDGRTAGHQFLPGKHALSASTFSPGLRL